MSGGEGSTTGQMYGRERRFDKTTWKELPLKNEWWRGKHNWTNVWLREEV